MVNYGSLSFAEQLAFFRHKLNLPTQRWDDLLGAAHDRAFVVAGAMQADLLADLRGAVDQAIAGGTTLEQFRKDFKQIVAKRGWTGWTGEGTKAGVADAGDLRNQPVHQLQRRAHPTDEGRGGIAPLVALSAFRRQRSSLQGASGLEPEDSACR